MERLLALLLSLAPYDPPARLEERARVIAEATTDLEERALLVAVDFNETTLGRRGIPFGATGAHAARQRAHAEARRAHTTPPPAFEAADGARSVLRILRRVRPWCGARRMRQERHWARMLGFFHHGAGCVVDAYSEREAALATRALLFLRSPQ